jgi:hypothetical protein
MILFKDAIIEATTLSTIKLAKWLRAVCGHAGVL